MFGAFVLIICSLLFGLGQMQRSAGGILALHFEQAFGLSSNEISLAIAVMFVATVIVQIPTGLALDRWGPKWVVSILMAIAAVGCCLLALSTTWIELLLSRIIIGIGFSSSMAAAYKVFSLSFPASEFTKKAGLMVGIGGFVGLCGTFPLAVLIETWGFELAFLNIGGASFLIGILTLFIVPEKSEGDEIPLQEPPSGSSDWWGYRTVLASSDAKRVFVMGLASFAPISAIVGLWGGPYFRDVHSLDTEMVGAYLFVLFSATILAGFAFGHLERRFGNRKVLVQACALTSSVLFLAVALIPLTPFGLGEAGLLFAAIFFQQFYIPLAAHNKQLFKAEFAGRASAILVMVSVLGIAFMQWALGLVLSTAMEFGLDHGDAFRVLFLTVSLFILICLVAYSRTERERAVVELADE